MKQRRKRTSTKRIDLKKNQIIPFDELFELAKPEMNKIVKAFGATKVYELLDGKIEGDRYNRCIYGHLTGDCNSPEAVDCAVLLVLFIVLVTGIYGGLDILL